jgi:hypothetical protein
MILSLVEDDLLKFDESGNENLRQQVENYFQEILHEGEGSVLLASSLSNLVLLNNLIKFSV